MVGKVASAIAEGIIRSGSDVENLKRLGYLTEESAQNPRAVKSARTKYEKALKTSEAKLLREKSNIEGETVVSRGQLEERPTLRPEDIEDTVLVAHKGDITATDVTIKELGGIELPEEVTSFGGANFPRMARNKEAEVYWASMKSAATPLQNKAEVLEIVQDMPVSAVYMSMGREGNYFNQAFADALLQKTQALNPPKSAMDQFDAEIRKSRPDWVGIRSPEARSQLLGVGGFKMEGAGKLRSTFVSEIQKARYRDQGFATIGNLEKALTDPDLVGAQLGEAGYTVGQIGGDFGLPPIDTHPSYNTGIRGRYLGGFERQVPPDVLFPDAWKKLGEELTKPTKGGAPKPLNYAQMVDALSKRKDLFQIADARWSDSVSKWLEDNPKKGMKAAIYAMGLPLPALMLLDPQQAQAEAIDAVYSSVDGELTDEQLGSVSRYMQIQNAYATMYGQTAQPEVYDSQLMSVDMLPQTYQPTFQNDDVTGKVLEARQGADLSPYDRAMMKAQVKQEPMTPFEAIPARAERFAREVTIPAISDIAGGLIEAPRQAVAGFLDATAEAARMMESIIPLGTISGAEPEYLEIEADPRTVTGAGVRAISQFVTGFIPALRGVKALGVTGIAAPAAAGAIADATVFDPQEDRLSNLIQEVPALQNPVTEYLAAGPEDTDAEGRLKNAIEGLALGGAGDSVLQGIKLVKSRRALVEVAEAEGKPVEQMIEEAMATMKGGTPAPREMPPGQEYIPFDEAAEAVQPTIRVPEFKPGTTEADPEAARNINLANLNTTEDVSTLIDEVAKADAPNINEARRQKITNDELPKLADDLGMTVEDLLARRQGEAFNAEQILAARKVLVASGENLVKLAGAAKNGSEMDLALFRRAMAQHRAIQSQVSGMTAEAGRALQSFRIVAASSREQERLIKEALQTTGGEAVSRDMAAMLSELDSPEKIGRFVKDANRATTKDQLYEIWINGLLSSPTTHMVNILSNVMVVGLTVGERKIASSIGGNIPPGETSAQLKGVVDGARDGFRLAWNVLKTGEPTDPLQKVEAEKFRAITSENLNIAGPAGRFADFMGEAVRVPGRLLTAGDEFFKSVGYRMELYSQAYRQAFNEGLRDEAAAKRVVQIIENPPENIKQAAVDASRYQTFTNQLGKTGKAVEQVRNNIPYARVVMPFVRTPVNIMSYTFERTPLAPLSGAFREEIAAGGARRDLAMGKLIAGSMVMAVSADLVLSGSVTGAGPTNPNMRNIMRATGWQPYSLKVGDKYYAYNRLDPVGALLGLSADVTEIIGQTSEAEASQLATAAALSVAQNMASKTYMSGVTDFFDAFFGASTDPEAKNYKLDRYLQRMASSIIPASVANIERTLNPELSATYGYLDRIKSRIPGYSEDLPPRRNIFGEPIVLEGGIGPDIMSPIYESTVKDDPVADEMVRQQVAVGMPRRQIQGIELDAQQYDRYVLLYSGIEAQMSLKKQLRAMFDTRSYKNATDGPEGGKALMIKSVFTAYRDMAQQQMLAEDDQLTNQITLAQEQRVEQLLGR